MRDSRALWQSIPQSHVGQSLAAGAQFACEPTQAGEQSLVPGVSPIGFADRLRLLADAPLLPAKPQRPADFGLFDMNARNQLELFAKRPTPKEQSS